MDDKGAAIAMTGKLYFDITDIVDYAYGHSRVSGIQRVVINVICDAAAKYGEEQVRCLFYLREKACFFECTAGVFVQQGEFDPERLLFMLGFLRNWKIFPSRMRIKQHLLPLRKSGNEIKRALRKADIYLSSILWPRRLKRYGLQRICERFSKETPVAINRFDGLKSADSLLLLGANWECFPIFDMAAKHAHAGGDVVQMVYDLIPHLFPNYFSTQHFKAFQGWLEKATAFPSRYMCISESTARDLREYLQRKNVTAQVVAIPLAHELTGFQRNHRFTEGFPQLQAFREGDYVLCVGTLEIRKNGARLLRAWASLYQDLEGRLPLLVFAGKRGWLMDEFDSVLAEHPQLQKVVSLVEAPSDRDLAYLYGNSLFTVFPSVYEGWGLPVGEAAWFGKYCLASKASSIPEVCRDLIDYVDPHDVDDIAAKLRLVISDRQYLAARETRIAAAQLRTWGEVARDICDFVTSRRK